MKYEILYDESTSVKDYNGTKHKVYRIKALKSFGNVREGDIGGWVEKDYNLSQQGNCWIFDNAVAMGNSQVLHHAQLMDNAKVSMKATIRNYAQIMDDARVAGNAKILDNVIIRNNVLIRGKAIISGKVNIIEKVLVDGKAKIIPILASLDQAVQMADSSNRPATHFVVGLAPDGGRLPSKQNRMSVMPSLSG